ncbi:MAG: hypothetical protein HYZ53_05790 [Planctomycetes bacterium]|nr:hypothetical protein [Planctomycetota bacterium]
MRVATRLLVLGLALSATLLVHPGRAGAGDDKRIAWLTDFGAGLKAAKDAKKPAFVDFMSPH